MWPIIHLKWITMIRMKKIIKVWTLTTIWNHYRKSLIFIHYSESFCGSYCSWNWDGRASCCGQFLGCLRCRWWSNYPGPGQYPRCLRGGPGIQQCVYMYALHCGPAGIQQLYATSAFRGRGDLFCLLNMRSQEILCKSFHLSDSDSNIVFCEFSFMSQMEYKYKRTSPTSS